MTSTGKTRVPSLIWVTALLLAMVFLPTTAHAAQSTTYVNSAWASLSAGDTVYFPGDSNPHTIGEDAFATIKDAFTNTDSGGTIYVADGTYTGTANEGLTINKNITIIGASASGTILDGGGSRRIFLINSSVTLTLQNLTLQNGDYRFGGAIYNDSGTLHISDCVFSGNSSINGGNAIQSVNGTVNIARCTFINNVATGSSTGTIHSDGTLNITDCIFTDNHATSGAAICVGTGTANIEGSTFTGNRAADGGAIMKDSQGGVANITNCIFTSNTADAFGGAIANFSVTNIVDCIFTNNSTESYGDGSAISNIFSTALLNIAGSTISGNSGGRTGDGIYNGYSGVAYIKYGNINDDGVGTGNATTYFEVVFGVTGLGGSLTAEAGGSPIATGTFIEAGSQVDFTALADTGLAITQLAVTPWADSYIPAISSDDAYRISSLSSPYKVMVVFGQEMSNVEPSETPSVTPSVTPTTPAIVVPQTGGNEAYVLIPLLLFAATALLLLRKKSKA